MKKFFMISNLLVASQLLAAVNLNQEALRCFGEMTKSLAQLACEPANKNVVEEAVCNLVVEAIGMVDAACKDGFTVTKQDCDDILGSLSCNERNALMKIFNDTDVKRSAECCTDETCTPDETTKGCCKCKDKCGCSSSSSSCGCCKSVEMEKNDCSTCEDTTKSCPTSCPCPTQECCK